MRRSRIGLSALALLVALVPLLVLPKPASAEVTELGWPYPPTNMDGYAGHALPVCNSTAKPGVVRLRDFLNFWYGPHSAGITRPCDGTNSYHIEGRALDYGVFNTDPAAQSIVNFMLASDEYGNPHARARRWGLEEIIWIPPGQTMNHIWKSYDRPWAGLQPCPNCSGDHSNHIHFSFSRAGANRQTSWFTTGDNVRTASCNGGTVTVKYWSYPSGFGPLEHVRSITGSLGNFTTQAALHNSPWQVFTALGPTNVFADSPVSALYTARVFRGSCIITI